MRRRVLREDDGFSLVELLAAMLCASFVLTGLLTIMVGGFNGFNRVTERVEGTQRARLAVDHATSLLSSQLCLQSSTGAYTPPIVAGSSDVKVIFYGNQTAATDEKARRYTLTFDDLAHTLREDTVVGSGLLDPTFTTAATTATTSNLYQARDAAGTIQPVFQYYAFDTANVGQISTTPLAVPLTTATAPTVAKVVVQLAAAGDHSGGKPDRTATAVRGEAVPATADPTTDSSQTTPTICPRTS